MNKRNQISVSTICQSKLGGNWSLNINQLGHLAQNAFMNIYTGQTVYMMQRPFMTVDKIPDWGNYV